MAQAPADEQSIFDVARKIDSAESRQSYLLQMCGHDSALHQRVAALLRAYEQSVSFLESPPPGLEIAASQQFECVTVAPPISEVPGTVIGPYKLLQQIGEGGMGVVFMAEQSEPIQRTVALKIIKPGMDTRQVIARFEAERQAVAMMDHPNIAMVLDAGATDSGRPYFVMELVKGVPITKYCDEKHLPIRARLELFVEVCQAVQHAHQKGIIHRDIKPNNVLVAEYDNQAVPKVIDFGVAKAMAQKLTERTMFTEFGQVLGTMEYMSPEQAKLNQLDIDTRSDIYSLGVLLYELLAGSTPFEGKRLKEAAFDEMLRIIREEEPQKPSTRLSSTDELPSIAANRALEPKKLSGLVTGELDWIVMKCLEKDRNRRYESANGFAADVQRYLADEPVQACTPSAAYRFKKFVRRNKGPVLAAAVVLLTLVGGIVGTTLGLVRAAERAEGERQARQVAQAREAETQAVLDFVENKIFAAARPEGQEGGLGYDVTLRQAIEAALPFVDESFSDRPLIEARLRMTLGESFRCLGEDKIAAEQFSKAREIYTFHLGPDHRDTLWSMFGLANGYDELGRHADASKLHEETLMLRKSKLGPDHLDTLGSMNNLAKSYAKLGRNAEALTLFEETLALYKVKLGPDHPDTLRSMSNLATVYNELGRHAEALKLFNETLALQRAELGADHPLTLFTMNNLANCYSELGRHADALKFREETLALRKAKLGAHHHNTLWSMNALANSYHAVGRQAEALKLREETLEFQKATLGPDHPSTLATMVGVAVSFEALGRHAEALTLNEETLELQKVKLGPHHRDTLGSMRNLALNYDALGRRAEALKLREETLALQKLKLGTDHQDTLRTMSNLASSYLTLGRYADAYTLFEATLKLRTAKLGPDHQDTLGSMSNLANSYNALDRHAEALMLREELLALQKTKLGHDHPDTMSTMHNLAISYAGLGRHPEALKLREETVALNRAKLGPDHADTLVSMSNLVRIYDALGQHDEALKLREEMLVIQKAKQGPEHPDTVTSTIELAKGYKAVERHAEALRVFNDAIRQQPDNARLYDSRGYLHFQAGRRREAIADFDKSLELDPNDSKRWYHAAAVYLYVRDDERYRNACRELLDRFETRAAENPAIADRVAKTCALAPDSVADFSRVELLAQRCITGTENDKWRRGLVLSKALADYRSGRHEESIEWLERFAPNADGEHYDATAFAALAMAHHQLGHADQARRSLDSAHAILAKKPQDWLGSSYSFDWMHCEILCREADELIGAVSPKESVEPLETEIKR